MSAKVRKIIGILDRIRVKYLFSAAALLLFAQLVFGSSVPRGMLASAAEDSLRQRLSDSLRIHSEAAAEVPEAATQSRRDRREQARAAREQARRRAAFEALPQEQLDSLITQKGDSLEGRGADTIARDTVKSEEDAEKFKKEIDAHRAEAEKAARAALRKTFLLRKIARLEKITLDQKEVDAQLRDMSHYYGYKEKEFRDMLEKNGGMDDLQLDLINAKVLNQLAEAAVK